MSPRLPSPVIVALYFRCCETPRLVENTERTEHVIRISTIRVDSGRLFRIFAVSYSPDNELSDNSLIIIKHAFQVTMIVF